MEKAGGIEEIYLIRHARIDYFGALVREKDGRFTVKGRAWFIGGQIAAFYNGPGNHETLRRRLVQITKAIAEFYNTTFWSQRFQKPLWPSDSSVMTDGMWCDMN